MSASLTDARRLYVALRDAGTEGVHSHAIRKMGLSGNPSQRAKDIVSHGVAVWTARENVGKRPGSRYWLADHAPDWAVPVRPNRAARTCANCGASIDGLRADAKFCGESCRSEGREARRAVQSRAGGGSEVGGEADPHATREPAADLSITPAPADTTEPVAICRDYTDPEGKWMEVPLSQLDRWAA